MMKCDYLKLVKCRLIILNYHTTFLSVEREPGSLTVRYTMKHTHLIAWSIPTSYLHSPSVPPSISTFLCLLSSKPCSAVVITLASGWYAAGHLVWRMWLRVTCINGHYVMSRRYVLFAHNPTWFRQCHTLSIFLSEIKLCKFINYNILL